MGKGVQKKVAKGVSTHDQWRVMRYWFKRGKVFGTADVVRATNHDINKVREFTNLLAKAGVLRLVKDLGGRAGGKRWQLAYDPGPKTPVQRPEGFYDPNSDKLIPYTSAKASEKPASNSQEAK